MTAREPSLPPIPERHVPPKGPATILARRVQVPRPRPPPASRCSSPPAADRTNRSPPPRRPRRPRRAPTPSSTPTAAARPRTRAARGTRRSRRRPRSSTRRKTYVATVDTNCGDVRDHARRQARAEDRRLVQVPGRPGLLRRPADPPDRARLRLPGRRPGGHRHRRPRLLGRRGAAEGPRVRARASSRWPRPATTPRARPARSSSSSPARTRRSSRPTTRCWARSRAASRSSTRSARSSPTRARTARTRRCVIESIRVAEQLAQVPDPAGVVGHVLERELEARPASRRRRSGRAGSRSSCGRRRSARSSSKPLEHFALAPSATGDRLRRRRRSRPPCAAAPRRR